MSWKQNTYSFSLDAPIPSKSSKSDAIANFRERVRSKIVSDTLLTGDVYVDVEVVSSLRKAMFTNELPDLDNILKPVMDALKGSQGLMVDDCQVVNFSINRQNYLTHDNDQLHVKVWSYAWSPRLPKNLKFYQVGGAIYFPVPNWFTNAAGEAIDGEMNRGLRTNVLRNALDAFRNGGELKRLMNSAGGFAVGEIHAHVQQSHLLQRFFHRSNIGDEFQIVQFSDWNNADGNQRE